MNKRLARWVYGSAFFTAFLIPALAIAEEAGSEAASADWQVSVGKAMAAGLAIGLSALGAGYAQGKIGSAGAGTLAERPEVATWVIILLALPEIIVLFGFVVAMLIINM